MQNKKVQKVKTITGLNEGFELVLIYLIPIFGLVFSLIKKKKVDENLIFHYNQSATIFILHSLNIIFIMGFLGNILSVFCDIAKIISLLLFVFSFLTLIRSLNGITYKAPIVSGLSNKLWKK